MTNLEIKQLYNFNRYPDNIIPVILYLPIGIVLVVARLVLLLAVILVSLVTPKVNAINVILSKILCFALGISINVENIEKKEDVEVIVSNHISIFDHFVIHSITRCLTPVTSLHFLSSLIGAKFCGPKRNETFKSVVLTHISQGKEALYIQPEAIITNGKAVLKFETWPFVACRKVQALVLQIQRPLINISVNTFNSGYWADVFFNLFSPITIYNVRFLPSAEKKSMEEDEFALRVQKDIARELRIEASEHTAADLHEWSKKYKLEQQRAQIRLQQQQQRMSSPSFNSELHRMALQVKEVLPMVPLNDILKDLMKTRNVDVTITNVLEGSVPYIPEPIHSNVVNKPNATTPPVLSTPGTSSSKGPFNTAAKCYAKTANERSLSFQERKLQLIENARQRYIEKHGLTIAALNNC